MKKINFNEIIRNNEDTNIDSQCILLFGIVCAITALSIYLISKFI